MFYRSHVCGPHSDWISDSQWLFDNSCCRSGDFGQFSECCRDLIRWQEKRGRKVLKLVVKLQGREIPEISAALFAGHCLTIYME